MQLCKFHARYNSWYFTVRCPYPIAPVLILLCVKLLNNLGDGLPFNDALLLIVSAHTIVVVAEIRTLHITQEFFVVGDDNELEVRLCLSSSNNPVE